MNSVYTIISPIVTEKATKLTEKQVYAFFVNKKATKVDIKNAIKELYGQEVEDVRIIISPAKTRIIKRATVDKRPSMKKALVTLKGGKKMDVTKLVKEPSKK